MFPQASIALYVRVTTLLQLEAPFVPTSLTWVTVTALQLSFAVPPAATKAARLAAGAGMLP